MRHMLFKTLPSLYKDVLVGLIWHCNKTQSTYLIKNITSSLVSMTVGASVVDVYGIENKYVCSKC